MNDWIVVHDAVRPFVSQEALERLWDIGSEEQDGAILAIPVSDTLKLGLVEKGQDDSSSVYIKKNRSFIPLEVLESLDSSVEVQSSR